MLMESLYGTRIFKLDEIEKTPESIINCMNETLPYSNVAFRDFNTNINIETVGTGMHFKVAEIEKGYIYRMKEGYFKIDNYDHFADLVLNFSFERLNEFDKDEDMSLKSFIDNLSTEEKDRILYELLKKKVS